MNALQRAILDCEAAYRRALCFRTRENFDALRTRMELVDGIATDTPKDVMLNLLALEPVSEGQFSMSGNAGIYPHYFRKVPTGATHIDIYRVLEMFEVSDPCLQHAIKKLMVAGGRGSKDRMRDIVEAMATLRRYQEMRAEERGL